MEPLFGCCLSGQVPRISLHGSLVKTHAFMVACSVQGSLDLVIGASETLPPDLDIGVVYFTTQVVPLKKGEPQQAFVESPTQVLGSLGGAPGAPGQPAN